MSAIPGYTDKPTSGAGILTTADTSRTAPTNAVTGWTPSVTAGLGGLVERITIVPLATVTATVLRLFKHDGTVYSLLKEIQVPAQTINASTAVITTTLSAVDYPEMFPIVVPPGWTLRMTTNDVQTGIKFHIDGGSL